MQTASGIALTCIVLAGTLLGTIIIIKAAEAPAPEPESVKPWPVAYTIPPSYYQNDTDTAPVMNSTKPAETTLTNESVDTPPEIVIPEIVIRIESGQDTETGTVVYIDGHTGANSDTETGQTTQNGANDTGRATDGQTPIEPKITPRSVGAAPEGAVRVPQDMTLDTLYDMTSKGNAYGMLIQADVIFYSDTRVELVGANPGWLHKDSVSIRGLEGVAVKNDIARVTAQVLGITRDYNADVLIHVLHVANVP